METWAPIQGYELHYEVSDLGRIRGLQRQVPHRGRLLTIPARTKELQTKEDGYVIIRLYKNGAGRNHRVNILVAQHHIPNPLNLDFVNHKRGNKADNRAAELEWTTRSDNMLHAYATGLITPRKGEKVNTAVLTADRVLEIRQQSGKQTERELAKIYGVSKSAIHWILAGKSWKHII